MPNPYSKFRLAAFERQQGRCYYCGFPMWLAHPEDFAKKHGISHGASSSLQCTAEHLKARQDGGGNSYANIVAACRFCNKTRHRMAVPPDPARYRQHIAARLRKDRWHPSHLQHVVARQRQRGAEAPSR